MELANEQVPRHSIKRVELVSAKNARPCYNDSTRDLRSGELGLVCKYDNGKATCKSGLCTLESCDSGFFKNGETCNALDLQSDVENCGKASNKCSFKDGSG